MVKRPLLLRWFVILLILVVCAVAAATYLIKGKPIQTTLTSNSVVPTVWVYAEPFSLDPLDYDAALHHLVLTAAFSGLVTQYQRGEIMGVVAESWLSSNGMRDWTFYIRSGLRFSNGDPITAHHVLRSLKRVAFIQKRLGSHSGLFEHLKGISGFTDLAQNVEGLRAEGQSLHLSFERPMPKLLETISFGLYSIVHPDDFDPDTGAWRASKQASTPGPYRISRWDRDSLELSLRGDFPAELRHPRAWQKLRVTWNPDEKDRADILPAHTLNAQKPADFEFQTTAATDVSIAYIHCFSWQEPDSPFYDIAMRRALRATFFSEIKKRGIEPSRSFFPDELASGWDRPIEALHPIQSMEPHSHAKKKLRIVKTRQQTAPFSDFMEAFRMMATTGGSTPEFVTLTDELIMKAKRSSAPFPADIGIRLTGISLEDPDLGVRFMVQSKEGIRLPDADGSLHTEMQTTPLDYRKLDRILWDQAIIWPLSHLQDGLWVRKGMFDFSRLNLNLPPTDFSWIGMNK